MAQVTVNIHNRPYQVACDDGQEPHVQKLAAYIDRRVGELASKSGVPGPAGQITETRLLVMAALLIADELGEAYDELEEIRQAPPKTVPDPASLRAAEEARAAASAARAQLVEAEAASRAAASRAVEAETGRRAAEEQFTRTRTALEAAEGKLEQAEAALGSALSRITELEESRRSAEAEQTSIRTTVASLSAQSEAAAAEEARLVAGLDSLSGRLEAMAERLERAAAR